MNVHFITLVGVFIHIPANPDVQEDFRIYNIHETIQLRYNSYKQKQSLK
jgi:hypothetical protein